VTGKPPDPFARREGVDEPGIVGSVWWNETLLAATERTTRRRVLAGIAALAGLAALGGVAVLGATSDDDEPDAGGGYREELRPALAAQRDFGWHFGVAALPFIFSEAERRPYEKSRLATLSADLEPRRADLTPFHQRTLPEAATATPVKDLAEADASSFLPLADALVPILTPSMEAHYVAAARWAAALSRGDALLVDLPGEDAIAFAAGLADRADPVLLVDNWPHPKGVVQAQLALAALAYYQPRFAETRARRPALAPPCFVLDRRRLAGYVDDATHFDNRWAARLPDAAALQRVGVTRLVYLTPGAAQPELADLNEAFVALDREGIVLTVRDPLAQPHEGPAYKPGVAAAAFHGGLPPEPGSFGAVPVVVVVASGLVAGAKLNRSGSWNRASSYGGGG
jgi:hypothetical protein